MHSGDLILCNQTTVVVRPMRNTFDSECMLLPICILYIISTIASYRCIIKMCIPDDRLLSPFKINIRHLQKLNVLVLIYFFFLSKGIQINGVLLLIWYVRKCRAICLKPTGTHRQIFRTCVYVVNSSVV